MRVLFRYSFMEWKDDNSGWHMIDSINPKQIIFEGANMNECINKFNDYFKDKKVFIRDRFRVSKDFKLNTSSYESVGTWWGNKNIPLVRVNDRVYALNEWDGEKYSHCWECTGDYNMDASKEEYVLKPIYREDGNGDYDIINFIVTEGD